MGWQEAAAEMRLRAASEVRALHSHAKQDGSGRVSHSHEGDGKMHGHTGLMPMVETILPGSKPRSSEQEPTGDDETDEAAERQAAAEKAADAMLARVSQRYVA
jgi:hypothetical protein